MPDDGIRAARDKSSVCRGEPERTPEDDKRGHRDGGANQLERQPSLHPPSWVHT